MGDTCGPAKRPRSKSSDKTGFPPLDAAQHLPLYHRGGTVAFVATTLTRIQVTVTPELERAISQARQVWPRLPTSQLVAALATAGATTLEPRPSRRQAVAQTAGVLRGAYPPGYLEDIRQDWPA